MTSLTVAQKSSLSFTISLSLLKLKSIESMMPSNHLIFYHSLLLPPSIFPSIRVFSNELAHRIRWSKYRSFSFGISPSNDYSGLISFRTDWFELLAVQGTLKSLLQHHNLKPIVWHSAFFGLPCVVQSVKHLSAMWETWVQFLGWEDPLEKEMAPHSSLLAWRIPWTEKPGGLQFIGS